MAERRPDPPDPRASLVDSGWSEPAIAPERELPAYSDAARESLVTRVDDQIQARIAAMNSDDRTVASSPFGSPAPSRPSRGLPPPPAPPALPPLPPAPARPVPPSARRHSKPPAPMVPVPSPLPELTAAPTDERTLVDAKSPDGSHLPPSQPPVLPPPPKPATLPPPKSLPPLPPSSLPPPPLAPSFAAMHSPTAPQFVPPPTLREALAERIQIGSAELPLWGVLAPALGLTALLSALLAGILTPSGTPPAKADTPAPAVTGGTTASKAASTSTPAEEPVMAPASDAPLDRARAGDQKALSIIERQKPQERSADEAIALSAGKIAQSVAAVGKLRARLAADPGLAKDPKIVADLRRLAQDPDTSRDALAAMAALPGQLSADLLYEAWTSTAERSQVTELAQALLLSRDVRPKASPALAIALDLREAETCEANAKILERSIDIGDKRAFAPMSRLLRHNGCGPSKRDDCYACLREGDLLKRALTAVKLRREPELVRRDTPAK